LAFHGTPERARDCGNVKALVDQKVGHDVALVPTDLIAVGIVQGVQFNGRTGFGEQCPFDGGQWPHPVEKRRSILCFGYAVDGVVRMPFGPVEAIAEVPEFNAVIQLGFTQKRLHDIGTKTCDVCF
jgi:hypothetical protein